MLHQDVRPSAQEKLENPLSIGFLVHDFPVYSETFVAESAEALIGAGCALTILALNGRGPVAPDWPRLQDRTLRLPFHRLPVGRPGGRLDTARQMVMLRHRPRFDVLHCQFGTTGFAAMLHRQLGTLRTRALVVHLRGYDITTFVRERGGDVYARLFRSADLFIANCAHFRGRAISLGCPPDKVIVIGSPIDTARFSPPETRSAGTTRLVAVGRLVEKKGFADAIAALGHVRESGREAVLDILGDGPLRAALEAQAAALGLGDAVRFRGAATSDQVIEALHGADIALTPSVRAASDDEDAAVNTAKEALATGLPVVATYHGGIPELMVPEENGLLVPERDPRALAGAIARLMDDPALRLRLGTAGRRKVVKEYDRHAILAKTLAAYKLALSGSGSTR